MEYDIIYSDRRTMSIIVKNGKVVVRAPKKIKKEYIEAFIREHREWVERSLEKSKKVRDPIADFSHKEIEELREKARIVLANKTKYYSEIMGLKYGRITITSAKTRFGSCSSKGNISYSYRLLLYPDAAIDYVVVHELAHLRKMNHSKEFYKIIESILPDYKQRIKLLKAK